MSTMISKVLLMLFEITRLSQHNGLVLDFGEQIGYENRLTRSKIWKYISYY
jgi:hypothetical protein